jgi:hypothetical protein
MNAEESEVSVLDLLLVVAENLRLLILGPILVGLLALAGAYLVPQSYISQAILALPTAPATQAAAMMVSPLVLDPIIESFNLSEGRSKELTRSGLASQIKAAVGKDGLLRLDVTAHSPAQAQAIANAVIDNWLKSTVPGDLARADLEKRLSYAQTSLNAVTRLIGRLDSEVGTNLSKPLTRGEAGTSFVGLGELQARYLGEVLSIPRELQGLSRDVVKQPPTLPTEPVSPKKGLIAALAAIAAGFVFLLWVFMRQAWRNAARDPQVAIKQGELADELGFKKAKTQ